MARMPGARWVGPHHDNGRMSRYDIVCIHTIVGRAPAHAAHFSTDGAGNIYQSRDTAYRSAANLNGNHRIIAIENEDMGPHFPKWNTGDGHAVPAFTDAQLTAIAKILAWAHKTHGVPLQLCPNSKPGSRGLAYHRQGIDGNFGPYKYPGRVAGGEVWTSARGKVCPGDRRIAQLPEILNRAKRIVNGENPEGDWFDMASKKDLIDAIQESWTHKHVKDIKEMVKGMAPELVDALLNTRVPLTEKQREYLGGLESITFKTLLIYAGMEGFANKDAKKAVLEALEKENR